MRKLKVYLDTSVISYLDLAIPSALLFSEDKYE